MGILAACHPGKFLYSLKLIWQLFLPGLKHSKIGLSHRWVSKVTVFNGIADLFYYSTTDQDI